MKVILLGDTNTDNTSIVLIGKDCKVIISEGCSIGGGKLVCKPRQERYRKWIFQRSKGREDKQEAKMV